MRQRNVALSNIRNNKLIVAICAVFALVVSLVVAPASNANAAGTERISPKAQQPVLIGTEKNRERPDSKTVYSYEESFSATGSSDTYKNIKIVTTPPDGSIQTGGYVKQLKALAGETIKITLTYKDGTTKEVSHVVTEAEQNSSYGIVQVDIDDATAANPYVGMVIEVSKMQPPASTGQLSAIYVTTKALTDEKYSDGTPISDLDIRNSTMTADYETESGRSGTVSGASNVQYHSAYINSDWTLSLNNSCMSVDLGGSCGAAPSTVEKATTVNYGLSDQSLSLTQKANQSSNTTNVIFEPVITFLLPKNTTYSSYELADALKSEAAPAVSTSEVDGQQVVTLDWSGTGVFVPIDANEVTVKWSTPEYGVTTKSVAAVWVSTKNEVIAPMELSAYTESGRSSLYSSVSDELSAAATGSDAHAIPIGSMPITLQGESVLIGTSSITDNQGNTSDKSAVNLLTRAADGSVDPKSAAHSLTVHAVSVNEKGTDTTLASLTNLPEDGLKNLQLSGAGTITDADGNPVTDGSVKLLYSTQRQEAPATLADLDLSGYSETVDDWASVKSFILYASNVSDVAQYSVTIPLADSQAESDLGPAVAITTTTYNNSMDPVTSSLDDSYVILDGQKTWSDSDNQDGIRPDSLTIDLLDETGTTVATTTTDASKDWKYSFTQAGLPVADATTGKAIRYTVKEESFTNSGKYAATYVNPAGVSEADYEWVGRLDIGNDYTPEVVSVSGSVAWDDSNDKDSARPDSVTVNLLANDEVVDSVQVTADSGWEYTFSDIAKFKAGAEIVYTVEEAHVPQGYTAAVSGFTITNTRVAAATDPLPGKSDSGTETEEAGGSGSSGDSTSPVVPVASASGALASTGVSVEVAVAAASVLMLLGGAGSVLARRRQREE